MTEQRSSLAVDSTNPSSYAISLYSPTRSPWHPKITPYRLAILTTTVALGTAKAIVTQRGGSLASTTLEWIGGTLLSIFFFSFSVYDSGKRVPIWLGWAFKPDCMDLVWNTLAFLFSVRRPEYNSDENSSSRTPSPKRPAITVYRTMVSGTIIVFGTSKAVLGYLGQSTSLTWLDWAIGTPIAFMFYILGLYENNPGSAWLKFFSDDKSMVLQDASINIIALIVSTGWATICFQMLRFMSDWNIEYKDPPKDVSIVNRFSDRLLGSSIKLVSQELLIGGVALGVVVNLSVINFALPRGYTPTPQIFQTPLFTESGRLIEKAFRVLFHVVFYLYITSVLLTACEICLAMAVVLLTEPQGFIPILVELFATFMGFICFTMAISALQPMLRNFPQ